MSYGLTPYDFVQQVFYAQEKVRLDFRPDDDKYKEVLMEANLVLQELQKEEDWLWLRTRLVLGSVADEHGAGQIPEFQLPQWAYKPSTLHDDCLRLYRATPSNPCMSCGREHFSCLYCDDECFDERDFIEVPYVSAGNLQGRRTRQTLGPSTNVPDIQLGCAIISDNILTFTRPLLPFEKHGRIAVCDVQKRLPLLHICNDDCPRDEDGKCTLIEDKVFTEIPDPNYIVIRTAALHAEGSPPAQGRLQSLNDNAQKLLSAMRENNSMATTTDTLDWSVPSYVSVV